MCKSARSWGKSDNLSPHPQNPREKRNIAAQVSVITAWPGWGRGGGWVAARNGRQSLGKLPKMANRLAYPLQLPRDSASEEVGR